MPSAMRPGTAHCKGGNVWASSHAPSWMRDRRCSVRGRSGFRSISVTLPTPNLGRGRHGRHTLLLGTGAGCALMVTSEVAQGAQETPEAACRAMATCWRWRAAMSATAAL